MEYLASGSKRGKKVFKPGANRVYKPEKAYGAFYGNTLPIKLKPLPKRKLGPFTTDATMYAQAPASGLRITWVGHSSLIIEVDGLRILTDPVWE